MSKNSTLPLVYITKYALTKGIYTLANVERCDDINPEMIADHTGYLSTFHKPDWHETRGEAVMRARAMRDAKIKSLRRQIERLEDMNFDVMNKP